MSRFSYKQHKSEKFENSVSAALEKDLDSVSGPGAAASSGMSEKELFSFAPFDAEEAEL